ncbi:MAG: ABC transporter ATP-binding protein [Parcubacteria group bacterium]|nr:ABC transporter ATP-binding protein [Parcubacteria group bacterium]
MNIVHVNDLGWWLIIFLNFVGYFILSFSSISNGTLKEVDKAIGTLLTTISFVLMLIFFGLVSSIILMAILWVVITPIVMVIIKQLEKKLFPYRIKIRKEYARKLNVTEEEVELVSQMNNNEFWKEMHKKYKWLDDKNIPDVIKQELVKKDEKHHHK